MSLRFPYRCFTVPQPLVPLAGRQERPRPMITITLLGPTGTRVVSALLDSGADDTIFPELFATDIGIDLSNAPQGTGAGVGLRPCLIRYAQVTLRLASRQEQREWLAWVGFTASPLRQPLLGFSGFLQFFTTTFYGDLEEVELSINSAYPGS